MQIELMNKNSSFLDFKKGDICYYIDFSKPTCISEKIFKDDKIDKYLISRGMLFNNIVLADRKVISLIKNNII